MKPLQKPYSPVHYLYSMIINELNGTLRTRLKTTYNTFIYVIYINEFQCFFKIRLSNSPFFLSAAWFSCLVQLLDLFWWLNRMLSRSWYSRASLLDYERGAPLVDQKPIGLGFRCANNDRTTLLENLPWKTAQVRISYSLIMS